MAKSGGRVIKDTNRIPRALRQLNRMQTRRVKVGIFADAPQLVAIGAINEFGTDIPVDAELHRKLQMLAREHGAPTDTLPKEGEQLRIPERSFLRATMDEKQDDVVKTAPGEISDMMLGKKDAYEAMMSVGKQLQAAVIDRVAKGVDMEPNDPFTIALKGHARPLIGRTGVLETTQGIRVKVVRKG